MPKVDVSIYAADSSRSSIRRAQVNEEISCSAPEFDAFRCLSRADLMKIYETFLLCEKWRPNVEPMGQAELFRLYLDLK